MLTNHARFLLNYEAKSLTKLKKKLEVYPVTFETIKNDLIRLGFITLSKGKNKREKKVILTEKGIKIREFLIKIESFINTKHFNSVWKKQNSLDF